MVLFADQIKFLSCLLMAGKAVQTETIIYVFETALIDLAAYSPVPELPPMASSCVYSSTFRLFPRLGVRCRAASWPCQQRLHEQNIDHRRVVDDQQVAGERLSTA
jgi:hypothetical protein